MFLPVRDFIRRAHGYQPNSRDNKPPNAHCVNMKSNACTNKVTTAQLSPLANRENTILPLIHLPHLAHRLSFRGFHKT